MTCTDCSLHNPLRLSHLTLAHLLACARGQQVRRARNLPANMAALQSELLHSLGLGGAALSIGQDEIGFSLSFAASFRTYLSSTPDDGTLVSSLESELLASLRQQTNLPGRCTHTHTHTRARTLARTRTFAHSHARTHTHTHTHTHQAHTKHILYCFHYWFPAHPRSAPQSPNLACIFVIPLTLSTCRGHTPNLNPTPYWKAGQDDQRPERVGAYRPR
jgi:hypothetical protein